MRRELSKVNGRYVDRVAVKRRMRWLRPEPIQVSIFNEELAAIEKLIYRPPTSRGRKKNTQ